MNVTVTVTIEVGPSVLAIVDRLSSLVDVISLTIPPTESAKPGRTLKTDNLTGFKTEDVETTESADEPEAKKEPVAKKPAKAKKEKADSGASASAITLDALMAGMTNTYKEKGKSVTDGLLAKYEIKKLVELSPDRYAELAVDLGLS